MHSTNVDMYNSTINSLELAWNEYQSQFLFHCNWWHFIKCHTSIGTGGFHDILSNKNEMPKRDEEDEYFRRTMWCPWCKFKRKKSFIWIGSWSWCLLNGNVLKLENSSINMNAVARSTIPPFSRIFERTNKHERYAYDMIWTQNVWSLIMHAAAASNLCTIILTYFRFIDCTNEGYSDICLLLFIMTIENVYIIVHYGYILFMDWHQFICLLINCNR